MVETTKLWSRVYGQGLMVEGLGGLGFRVQSFGFGFRGRCVLWFGLRIEGFGFGTDGVRFRIQGID